MNNLQFKVRDIENGETVIHQVVCNATDLSLEVEEVNFIHPISGWVKFFRQNAQVYVTAQLSTEIEVECSRCLQIFETTLKARFEVQYRPTSDPEQEGWLDEDLGVRYYTGEYINITEDIYQAMMVEIPLWPICLEECKGLCQRCGHNLNLGNCNCHQLEGKSPQFAVLEELLKQTKQVTG
ncbi:TPA: DUF177 domain-containing protein [Candidatus Poribacteria bacterium]|nr:DUF177 domain-containing protein [Candidatus Poribacteria bacterium]